ncbi:unnamed protein product [Trifolium pratense]|uniref:Uncharacterized protein n=1 Tax=Trifolium pratense TaxID=57577 RepID=A0ACB0JE89_TRIPR|nr:unnamed protein product [Trifolium pratense]
MMMSERTIIPTFAFWALLTIITPTLILLSENSKADLHLNGNITETMKVRRMNGHTQNNNIIRTAPPPQAKLMLEEELAPAPAATVRVSLPLPTPSRSYSHHNHTLISNDSNSTDDVSKSKVQIQVQQTNVKYKST